jgi:hypothetical protein
VLYSPTLCEDVPAWVFYFDAICVMYGTHRQREAYTSRNLLIYYRLYHTFDGIDGKQAMKNRDSEIEELYDHGADAITSVLQALLLAAALQLPVWAPNQAFCLLTLSLLAVFGTHFTAHVTHTFVFADLDVAEAQCVLAGTLVLTGYFGQEFWHQLIIHSTPVATLVNSARCHVGNASLNLNSY